MLMNDKVNNLVVNWRKFDTSMMQFLFKNEKIAINDAIFIQRDVNE